MCFGAAWCCRFIEALVFPNLVYGESRPSNCSGCVVWDSNMWYGMNTLIGRTLNLSYLTTPSGCFWVGSDIFTDCISGLGWVQWSQRFDIFSQLFYLGVSSAFGVWLSVNKKYCLISLQAGCWLLLFCFTFPWRWKGRFWCIQLGTSFIPFSFKFHVNMKGFQPNIRKSQIRADFLLLFIHV